MASVYILQMPRWAKTWWFNDIDKVIEYRNRELHINVKEPLGEYFKENIKIYWQCR